MAGVSYDPNVDYKALMDDAEKRGDYAAAAQYEQQRNQKLADMAAAGNTQWGPQTNKYSQNSGNAGVTQGTAYNPNTDYQALINQADREGRYSDAAYYEQLRNQKLADLEAAGNTQWGPQTNKYSQYLGNGYTSLNSYINGNSDLHYEEVDKLKDFLQQNPNAAAQLTQENLLKLANQYGIDPSLFSSFSQHGGYVQNGSDGQLPGTGEEGWGYVPGQQRPVANGTSGADEQFLSDGSYALIQQLKSEWNRLDALAKAAKDAGNTLLYNQLIADRNQCNILANQIRNLAGYSGGTDGSMYIPNGQLGIDDSEYPYRGGNDIKEVVSRPSGGATMPPSGSVGGGSTIPPSGSVGGGGSTMPPSGSIGGGSTWPPSGGNTGGSILPPSGGNNGGSTIPPGGGTTGGNTGGSTLPPTGGSTVLPTLPPGSNTGGSLIPPAGDNSANRVDLNQLLGDLGKFQLDPLQTKNFDELKAMLDSWQNAAMSQQNGQVDYAVQQAIAQLQRALEDADPQFKTMAESAARDEMQALDNSALYAQLRGDQGGIGQAQYNSIQNAAAQNRLSVQQAQTKLATDTERQIADLRAQGEFQKADAALEITQQYLSQLMSLQQWAEQYNLSIEQFNAQLQQWEAEYQMALKQLTMDADMAYGQLTGVLPSTGQNTMAMDQFLAQLQQWEKEYQMAQDQFRIDADLAYGQLTGKLPSTGQNTMAMDQFLAQLQQWEKEYQLAYDQYLTDKDLSYGQLTGIVPSTGQNTLAQNQYLTDKDLSYGQLTGIVPSTGQNTLAQNQYLSGLDQWEQEFQFAQQQHQDALKQWEAEFGLAQQQAQNNQSSGSSGSDSGSGSGSGSSMDYEGLFKAAQESGHPQSFIANNYKKYGFTSSSGLYNDYKAWAEDSSTGNDASLKDLDMNSVLNLGMGSLSYEEVESMVQMGALVMFESGNKIGVKWASGWNADKWNQIKNNPFANGGFMSVPGIT